MANDYTYRADHVGGLTPPAALIEARARHARGELDADGLRAAEDAAITAALQMQKAVGVAVASDGEMRRAGGATPPLDGDAARSRWRCRRCGGCRASRGSHRRP
jgi:methionine synthase II (cobalamin-independent)